MSNSSSIKLSAIAAFSYHWNKGIDSKEPYFIRLGKSMSVFFKTLFCDYIVYEVDAKAFFSGGHHKSSLFIQECNKKFENFTIEIVNDPASGAQGNYDRVSVKNVFVDELEELIRSEDFIDDTKYFSKDKLKLLKQEDCLRLFDSALSSDQSNIALLLLLTKKCDKSLNLLNKGEVDALPFFIERGIERGVKYLLDNDLVGVNDKNYKGDTPIMTAAKAGKEKCLKILLDKGANINSANHHGMTALQGAAIKGHEECLKVLVEAGANLNSANHNGMTALHGAAMKGHGECLKVLVEAGANLNDTNTDRSAALHSAVMAKSKVCVNVLVNAGAETNNLTNSGLSPLHIAAKLGFIAAVNVLLKAPDINVNVRNHNGETPLHIAARDGKRGCFMALVDNKNIDLKAVDKNDRTPLDYAIKQNNTEFIKQLRSRIAVTENVDHDDKNNSDKQEPSEIKDSKLLDYDNQNNSDKQEPSEIKDSKFLGYDDKNNSDKQEPSEIKDSKLLDYDDQNNSDKQEISEIKDSKLTEETNRVDELLAVMNDKNFRFMDERLSKDKLKSLGLESRVRLFKCAAANNQSIIISILADITPEIDLMMTL